MRLLYAAATMALLAACGEQAAGDRIGDLANNAAPVEVSNATAPEGSQAPLGAPVSGEEAKRVMHDRHEGMEEIGDAMKLVSRELKGSAPDLAKVRQGAGTMARLAPRVSGWFPPGTGPDVGKTEALAEIWQKPEDFAAKTGTFQKAARAFNAAAQGDDLAAIRAAHGELGKSCKACHDLYREKDE